MPPSSGSSWETTSYRSDPLRKGLVERAKQRKVRPKRDPNWWAVSGNQSLGDSYDNYDVHLREDGSWYCSCSTSTGGQYRKDVCSHRTAVILWRRDHDDPWEEEEEDAETRVEGSDESKGLLEVDGADDESVWGNAGEVSAPSTNDSPNDFKGSGGGGAGGPHPMRDVAGSRMTLPPEAQSGEGGNDQPGNTDGSSSPDTSRGEADGGVKESADSNPVSPLDQLDRGFDPFELDWDEPPEPQTISAVMEKPTLPDKFTAFRDTQWHGIIEAVEAIDDGVKCVFLSAPTGTGKSLVAATVPQILDKHFVYTATTHTLQEQIEREFGYAKVLKGRRNYPTVDDPSITADDCTKEKTTLPACPSCPGWGKGSTWGTTSYDDERGENVGPHCFFCFVPETEVEWPDLVTPMRRWYEGSMVEISTASGHKLSGTPDHPILTDRGWVSLGLLEEGDRVVSRVDSEDVEPGNPDPKNRPPSIGEVYGAATVAASVANEGVPGIDVYLDVERLHPEIEVVPLDRLLEDGGDSSLFEPGFHLSLSLANPTLRRLKTAIGDGLSFLFGVRSPANSLVRAGGILSSLLRGHLRHTIPLPVTSIADGSAGFSQEPSDDIFTDAETLGEGNHRFPFDVEFDEVREVREFTFSGHVYNLHTEQNWYLANGIVAHNCHPVSRCPYEVAKTEANYAHMAVLNTTYFLSETNYVFRSMFRNKDLVFIDEADMLEDELMSFITVEITAKTRKDLNIGLPEKKTVEESWVVWIRDDVVPAIKAKLADLPKTSGNLFGKPDTKTLRARTRYKRLLGQVMMLLEPPPPPPGEEPDEDENGEPALLSGWVMTGYETRKGEDKQEYNMDVIFKPITVRNYARRYLWNQGKQFVLMSATIISPEQMAYDLGLEDDEWVTVEIPSSFPKERRPVVPRAEIEVTKKTMDSGEAYPILVSQLFDIMEEHPDERILVHSNSYKLTRELFFETRKKSPQARKRLYAYFYANERDKALNGYLDNPRGVLVAPSFERGVDLHGDDCRVIVIAKVPWPYLGDKQISARLYGTGKSGKSWYAVQTIRTICQMTGRAMRSQSDWAISYILDKSFLRIYWENQNLFPAWWREAIVFDENDPKWKEPLADLKNGRL